MSIRQSKGISLMPNLLMLAKRCILVVKIMSFMVGLSLPFLKSRSLALLAKIFVNYLSEEKWEIVKLEFQSEGLMPCQELC